MYVYIRNSAIGQGGRMVGTCADQQPSLGHSMKTRMYVCMYVYMYTAFWFSKVRAGEIIHPFTLYSNRG